MIPYFSKFFKDFAQLFTLYTKNIYKKYYEFYNMGVKNRAFPSVPAEVIPVGAVGILIPSSREISLAAYFGGNSSHSRSDHT